MTGRNRRNFSPEFRLEAAQHYTVADTATAMNVGKFTMDTWVRQLNVAHSVANDTRTD